MSQLWVSLNTLHPARLHDAVKLRLLSHYDIKTRKNAENTVYAHQAIFQDVQGNRIHAVCAKHLISHFKPLLKEGEVHSIENLIVSKNTQRLTEHNYQLTLVKETIVRVVDDESFPGIIYKFGNFKDLNNAKDIQNRVMFDLIGLLSIDRPPTQKIGNSGAELRFMDVCLEDLDGQILPCTLWASYVDKMMDFVNQKPKHPVVVIFQLCKGTVYGEQNKATTFYDVTKLFLDQKLQPIAEFKKKLVAKGISTPEVLSFSGSTSWSLPPTIELKSLEEVCDNLEKDRVWVMCKIASFEHYGPWCYTSCTSCYRKLSPNNGTYFCGICNKSGFVLRDPSIQRLCFHLPDRQPIIYSEDEALQKILSRKTINQSMFLSWFEANKTYPEAKLLTYAEFPTKFVWKKGIKAWVPRKKRFSIGRMYYVPLTSGEVYYLRCLLNLVRGPCSFEDIRTVNGIVYPTFRDACCAMGLVDDDKEYIDAIIEASNWSSERSLRNLFATLLASECLVRPEDVWDKCWKYLSDDILYSRCLLLNFPGLRLSEAEIKNYALAEIESLLHSYGKSLRHYHNMPFPDEQYFQFFENRLINDELCYDRKELAREHASMLSQMTSEQRNVYSSIMDAVLNKVGGMFFVYGYGGTGKTFLWRTLSAALRSKGEIVLNVASSGIASLLLPGGRTAHSRFKIPLTPNEESMCNIHQGSPLAQLIIRTTLIIWDEAPMTHKYCFEALDRTFRDILRVKDIESQHKIFGGKTIVFGGDFRQILPVVTKGRREDIVNATINASYLWENCTVLKLTKNMRLLNDDFQNSRELQEFTDWLANIGDGKAGGRNDGIIDIPIPKDLLIEHGNDPIQAIVEEIYPESDGVIDSNILEERAILAPTLQVVEAANDYMMSKNSAEKRIYYSVDSMCQSDMSYNLIDDIHTTEFLNTIKSSGIPNHEIRLKIGTPIMLLRNIDHAKGLCNGTRLIVTRLGDRVLEAKVITGSNAGEKILLPRISLTPSDTRLPFKFQRKQFPIMVSYAMTINKSREQSLSKVGLLLKKPVFSHGQLYVAMSRVRRHSGLKILICNDGDKRDDETTNVVFKEVFQNI